MRVCVCQSFDIGANLGFGLTLGRDWPTRLAKGAPRLHNPLLILVHAAPGENNPHDACHQHLPPAPQVNRLPGGSARKSI